jgi:hypothetical protein
MLMNYGFFAEFMHLENELEFLQSNSFCIHIISVVTEILQKLYFIIQKF